MPSVDLRIYTSQTCLISIVYRVGDFLHRYSSENSTSVNTYTLHTIACRLGDAYCILRLDILYIYWTRKRSRVGIRRSYFSTEQNVQCASCLARMSVYRSSSNSRYVRKFREVYMFNLIREMIRTASASSTE